MQCVGTCLDYVAIRDTVCPSFSIVHRGTHIGQITQWRKYMFMRRQRKPWHLKSRRECVSEKGKWFLIQKQKKISAVKMSSCFDSVTNGVKKFYKARGEGCLWHWSAFLHVSLSLRWIQTGNAKLNPSRPGYYQPASFNVPHKIKLVVNPLPSDTAVEIRGERSVNWVFPVMRFFKIISFDWSL